MITLYLFLIIVLLAIIMAIFSEYKLEILLISATAGTAFLYYLGLSNLGLSNFGSSGVGLESRENFIPISNMAVSHQNPNINVDDIEYSRFGNISLTGDIDSMQQRLIGLDLPPGPIDNSDVVAQVVQRGNTVFQPSGVGITTTDNAMMSKFSLAGPSGIAYMDMPTSYDIPQANNNSLDELIARAGKARGSRAQQAIDGRVRSTRNLYNKYFQSELKENADREWWGNTGDEMETDFTSYDLNL